MDLLLIVVLVAVLVFGVRRLARVAPGRRPGAAAAPNSLGTAEADARRWLDRLAREFAETAVLPGATTHPAAAEALHDARLRLDRSSAQFASAGSPYHYALAGRSAIEGLHHVGAARTALGAPAVPGVPSLGPALQRAGQVTVAGVNYYAATRPSLAMPYFFPGGTVAGRIVPAAWFGQPWWRAATPAGGPAMVAAVATPRGDAPAGPAPEARPAVGGA